jgi:hypothetical protein
MRTITPSPVVPQQYSILCMACTSSEGPFAIAFSKFWANHGIVDRLRIVCLPASDPLVGEHRGCPAFKAELAEWFPLSRLVDFVDCLQLSGLKLSEQAARDLQQLSRAVVRLNVKPRKQEERKVS